MLHIFYVDIAKPLRVEMYLVNETVEHLKYVVEELVKIPVNKQVMLVSGGNNLKDENKVCTYSAGTDTNPIYLFNRVSLERSELPCINLDIKYNSVTIDAELNHSYESTEYPSAPISMFTFTKINNLAQKYLEQATETKALCDELKGNLFMQQQGWSAAIANLEDVLADFKTKCELFDLTYTKYLETRQENLDLINRFSKDLELLSRIPLLSTLLEGNEEERARLEICFQNTNVSDISLLQWISSKEPEQSLENVIITSRTALEKYDENALIKLKNDIHSLFSSDRMKDIRDGSDITEKLTDLDRVVSAINVTYEDQAKKARGIKRNLERAQGLKDDCVIPDLIDTHRNTIRTMKANHTNLRSCRQLCLQCKVDLCEMVHKRLKIVMIIQETISEIMSKLVLHSGNLKHIRDYIDLIQQLHTAPKNYFAAVSEVVRRRSYSQAFLMWASDLACRIFSIYTEETERRKKFISQFEGHFLNCLFPGLDDMPPPFAIQSPPLFDNNLPTLCEDDLKHLCQNLPDLENFIQIPDVDSIRNFFLSKSLTLSEINSNEDILLRSDTPENDKLAIVMSTSSTSDTYMFAETNNEKTSNSFNSKGSICALKSNDNSEEMNHEEELRTMRSNMAILGTVAHNTVISLRKDLSSLRNWVSSHQSEFISIVNKLYSHFQEQQLRINKLLECLSDKEDKIRSLYVRISAMETEHLEEMNEEEKFEKRMKEERERIIKEVTENLNREHKKEIDILRQRFKLMTCANIERTSSDTNLEKIERGDFIDITNHDAVVNQLKHNMESQLNSAIANERAFWDSKLEQELREANSKFNKEKQMMESMKQSLIEQYEKQLENMKIRETALLSELQRHKETIHTLTYPEGGSFTLLNRIEELERQKNSLEEELIKERHSKYACNRPAIQNAANYLVKHFGTSVTTDNPELMQNKTTFKEKIVPKKSTVRLNEAGSSQYLQNPGSEVPLCFHTCNVGDIVLVIWDETQKHYTILQTSSVLYFVHPNSLEELGLHQPTEDEPPRMLPLLAEVVEKEFCVPKKTVNRYNLKEGQRFYRVKVKPKFLEPNELRL